MFLYGQCRCVAGSAHLKFDLTEETTDYPFFDLAQVQCIQHIAEQLWHSVTRPK